MLDNFFVGITPSHYFPQFWVDKICLTYIWDHNLVHQLEIEKIKSSLVRVTLSYQISNTTLQAYCTPSMMIFMPNFIFKFSQVTDEKNICFTFIIRLHVINRLFLIRAHCFLLISGKTDWGVWKITHLCEYLTSLNFQNNLPLCKIQEFIPWK